MLDSDKVPVNKGTSIILDLYLLLIIYCGSAPFNFFHPQIIEHQNPLKMIKVIVIVSVQTNQALLPQ